MSDLMIAALRKNRLASKDDGPVPPTDRPEGGNDDNHELYSPEELCAKIDSLTARLDKLDGGDVDDESDGEQPSFKTKMGGSSSY